MSQALGLVVYQRKPRGLDLRRRRHVGDLIVLAGLIRERVALRGYGAASAALPTCGAAETETCNSFTGSPGLPGGLRSSSLRSQGGYAVSVL